MRHPFSAYLVVVDISTASLSLVELLVPTGFGQRKGGKFVQVLSAILATEGTGFVKTTDFVHLPNVFSRLRHRSPRIQRGDLRRRITQTREKRPYGISNSLLIAEVIQNYVRQNFHLVLTL